jgi:hypothetical protein
MPTPHLGTDGIKTGPVAHNPKEVEKLVLDNLLSSQSTKAEDLAEVLNLPLTDVKDSLSRLFLQGAVKLDPDAQGGWRLPTAKTDPEPDEQEDEADKAQFAQEEAVEPAQPKVPVGPTKQTGEFREPESPVHASRETAAQAPDSPPIEPPESTPLARTIGPKKLDAYLLELLDGEEEEERFRLDELDGYNDDDVRNKVPGVPRYAKSDIEASLLRLVEQRKVRVDPNNQKGVGWYLPKAKTPRLPPKESIEKKLIQARDKLVKMTTNMAHERWRDFAIIVEAVNWHRNAQAAGRNDLLFDLGGDDGPIEGNAAELLSFMFGDTGPKATQYRKTIDYLIKNDFQPDQVYAWIEENHGLDEAYRNEVAKKQTNPRTSGGNQIGSPAPSSISAGKTTTAAPIGDEPSASSEAPSENVLTGSDTEESDDGEVWPDPPFEIFVSRDDDAEEDKRESLRLFKVMNLAFDPRTTETEAIAAFLRARARLAKVEKLDLANVFYFMAKYAPVVSVD